eukprot:COSAG01_NODE_16243_length_1255_cov_21.128893_1_plen_392_part_10
MSVLASDALIDASCIETCQGIEDIMLMAVAAALFLLKWELGSKCRGSCREAMERQWRNWFRQQTNHMQATEALYSGDRIQELLPLSLTVSASEDLVVACGLMGTLMFNLPLHSDARSLKQLASVDVLNCILTLHGRIVNRNTPAEWWAARAEAPSLQTLCLAGPWLAMLYQAMWVSSSGNDILIVQVPQWGRIMDEAVSICLVMQVAKLTHRARPECLHAVPGLSLRVLANISTTPSAQRSAMASDDCVSALLYIVEHDCEFAGISTATFAAMTAVNLIGRNEGGLTLTRQAVYRILKLFCSYLDPSSRRSKYPVNRMVGETKALVHLIIPDANKAFVVEHAGALDSLVCGLLLDESNPRRHQEGAVELQQMCALVLQNLALSPIGAGPLRA